MSKRMGGLVLAGILLLSLNLRPTAVSVGPVLADLREALGMSPAVAGLLTSLPVIAFAVFGSMAPWLGRVVGTHRVTLVSLAAVAAGLLGRALTSDEAVFLGCSLVALAGMAMANVLLPSLVKLHFPDRIGRVTALYTTMLAVGLTLALTLTVPIADAAGSWRVGLGVWAVIAVVAALPWLTLIRHDAAAADATARVGFVAVLRTPLGLAMVGFFGLQSLQAYAIFGWFATLWRDAGYSPTAAGLLVGLIAAFSIPLTLWAPAALARSRDPRLLVAVVIATYPLGYLGLILAPRALAVPCALLLGVGVVTFPLVLVLVGLRARTAEGTATLSSVTQSVGYLIAALGPFSIGLLHDATDGWTWPLLLLTGLCVPQLLLGIYASRPAYIEDQVRTRPPAAAR